MTLKTNRNRQSNVTLARGERAIAGPLAKAVSGLRRVSHHPGAFLAEVILAPGNGDVNLSLETCADDFAGVTPNANATALVLMSGGALVEEPGSGGEARIAAGFDEEDEDEDEDEDEEEDLDYEDDDLDEDEDLDDEDEFDDDDLNDEDDDLDDDALDDEDIDEEE